MSSTLVNWSHRTPPARGPQSDQSAIRASAGGRLTLIAESFARLSGRPLVEASSATLEQAMWQAPHAIIANGTEPQPRLFYGNRVALELFAMMANQFVGTIAHSLAEPVLREESQRIAAGLAQHDIVDMYAIVGIAANGRRFAISNAQVWNIVDQHGGRHGLGTTFTDWQFLDRS